MKATRLLAILYCLHLLPINESRKCHLIHQCSCFEVCPFDAGMDQNVELKQDRIVIQPTPSTAFSPEDLVPGTGNGVTIPRPLDAPNPTIEIKLTDGAPVNVVLITLFGKIMNLKDFNFWSRFCEIV